MREARGLHAVLVVLALGATGCIYDLSRADASLAGDRAPADTPCASGFVKTSEPFSEQGLGSIVACADSTARLTQCDAANACNAGWELCNVDRYKAFYDPSGVGDEPPPQLQGAWLAGCVEFARPVPKTTACTSCPDSLYPWTPATSNCSTGAPLLNQYDSADLGLISSESCLSIGTPGSAGYWALVPASQQRRTALCCTK